MVAPNRDCSFSAVLEFIQPTVRDGLKVMQYADEVETERFTFTSVCGNKGW